MLVGQPNDQTIAMADAVDHVSAIARAVATQPTFKYLSRCLLAWSSLFLILRFVVFRTKSPAFSNVVVSQVHAAVALWLAAHIVDWRHPFDRIGDRTSDAEVRLIPAWRCCAWCLPRSCEVGGDGAMLINACIGTKASS